MAQADSPATWSNPDSTESVTKRRNCERRHSRNTAYQSCIHFLPSSLFIPLLLAVVRHSFLRPSFTPPSLGSPLIPAIVSRITRGCRQIGQAAHWGDRDTCLCVAVCKVGRLQQPLGYWPSCSGVTPCRLRVVRIVQGANSSR